MASRTFQTFAEASAFARIIAQERNALVHVVRRGAAFMVESKAALEPMEPQAPKPTPAARQAAPSPEPARAPQFVVESKATLEPAQPQAPKPTPPAARQAPTPPKRARPPTPNPAPVAAANERLCIECGVVIPPGRVKAVPTVSRCMKCQESFEQNHDTRRRIDEGLAGTREGHKKMRGQLWGDMRNRGRGR